MNLPRSTYYYRSARTLELTDGELTTIIEDVQDAHVGYPRTIRVDNGSEFISRDLDLWAYANDVIGLNSMDWTTGPLEN